MKYRSKFEEALHKANPDLLYEPKEYKLEYKVAHVYQPDFIDQNEDNIYYEAKGRFQDRPEARKYVEIQQQHPEIEIVFLFQNPRNKMPGARPRKDGTTLTMAEWADKHGFRYQEM